MIQVLKYLGNNHKIERAVIVREPVSFSVEQSNVNVTDDLAVACRYALPLDFWFRSKVGSLGLTISL